MSGRLLLCILQSAVTSISGIFIEGATLFFVFSFFFSYTFFFLIFETGSRFVVQTAFEFLVAAFPVLGLHVWDTMHYFFD